MNKATKVIISAFLNAAIVAFAGYQALLQQVAENPEITEISNNALLVVMVGALLALVKDLQAALTNYETTGKSVKLNAHWLPVLLLASVFFLGGCESVKRVPVVGPVVAWLTPGDPCSDKFDDKLLVNSCRTELGFQAEYDRLTKAFNSATSMEQVEKLSAQRKEVDRARMTLKAIQAGAFEGDAADAVDRLTRRLEEMAQ